MKDLFQLIENARGKTVTIADLFPPALHREGEWWERGAALEQDIDWPGIHLHEVRASPQPQTRRANEARSLHLAVKSESEKAFCQHHCAQRCAIGANKRKRAVHTERAISLLLLARAEIQRAKSFH